MYEGGIRVPGIARWPGKIRPGSTCDQPVVGSDFFPTACGLAGIQVPQDRVIDGVDALGMLTGAPPPERKVPLYWRLDMAPAPFRMAMRKGDWKILASNDLGQFELYNLKEDPAESRDKTRDEPARFEAMKKELTALNAQIEAEGPDWWKRLNPNGGVPAKK